MRTWANEHLLLFAGVGAAGIVVFRWLLLTLMATASGWKVLANRFAGEQPFSGSGWKWQSARMRFLTGYNNCLRVGADPAGLSIQPMWGIRTAHSALFIPWREIEIGWREIEIGPASGWMGRSCVRLSLGRAEQISFTVSRSLADRLQAAAGANWPATPFK
jgi:hypothetical protein